MIALNASSVRRAFRKAADNEAVRRTRFMGDHETAVFHVAFALATALDLDWEKIPADCRAELQDVADRVYRRLTTGHWSG